MGAEFSVPTVMKGISGLLSWGANRTRADSLAVAGYAGPYGRSTT